MRDQNLEGKLEDIVKDIKNKGKEKTQLKYELKDLIKKGDMFYEKELFKEALNCYNKVLIKDECNWEVWLNKGYSLLFLDRWNDSINHFDRIIKSDYYKGRSSAYLGKATALELQEKYVEALEALENSKINLIDVRLKRKELEGKVAYQKAKWPKKIMLTLKGLLFSYI